MKGTLVGVFGSEQEVRTAFLAAIGKKSEAEGIVVYRRVEGGRIFSFLDTSDFPGRIQGFARIASLADHALYLYPKSGALSAPDGELAVLLTAGRVNGTLEILDGSSTSEAAGGALKGTAVAGYPVEERSTSTTAIDLSRASEGVVPLHRGTLIYVDRIFSVKGVGTVALGFVLSGAVKVHDKLRPLPGPDIPGLEVRGIQIKDEDFDEAGRGIRVGLSLRGADAKELERTRWLDDGSFQLADDLSLEFEKSNFYRQNVEGRDLHLQLPGEMVSSRLDAGIGGLLRAKLPFPVPVWDGMKSIVIDLNGKNLRVAGGAIFRKPGESR